MDGYRVFREAHPGAVYLHRGDTYLVDELDPDTHTVRVVKAQVDFYTRVRGYTDTEIIEIYKEKQVYGTTLFQGRLRVTDQVTGYEKWQIRGNHRRETIPLDLPPQVFDTEGIWFVIPRLIQEAVEDRNMDFLGGIHAAEHAAIGIFPLLVMADRNDLGGMSTAYHPETAQATIFIYDGVPGGAGFCRQAYAKAEGLIDYSLEIIEHCGCESGCPACIQSPKCGSGNRPIDKIASRFILTQIQRRRIRAPEIGEQGMTEPGESSLKGPTIEDSGRVGIFDLETLRSAQEVGGWHMSHKMGVSCGVVCDLESGNYLEFLEHQVPDLIHCLSGFDLVVGFNIKRFDYKVLSGYTLSEDDLARIPTLDILEKVKDRLGFRLSLDRLAQATLKTKKSADGLQALRWWREGRHRDVIDYCKWDVTITKDLYLFGKKNGYLLFTDKQDQTLRIPVDW